MDEVKEENIEIPNSNEKVETVVDSKEIQEKEIVDNLELPQEISDFKKDKDVNGRCPQKHPQKHSIKKIIFIVLISIVLFIYSVILVNGIMNKQAKTKMFPYTTCVAVENIDKAKINKGDLIIIKAVDVSEIKVGDAVVFEKDGSVLINTISDVKNDNGTTKLIMDSDETISKQSFTSDIKGKSITTIKGLGNVSIFVKTPLGTFIIITTIICVIASIKSILNHNKQKEQNIFFVICKYILIAIIVIFNSYAVIKTVIAQGKAPELFKYKAFTILSNSMGDNLKVGDVAIVKSLNDAQVDDIIAFRTNNEVVLHRVVEKIEKDNTTIYKTKGDSNENADLRIVDKSDIEGIYNSKIQYIGYVLIFLYKYYMYIIVIALIYLLFKIV